MKKIIWNTLTQHQQDLALTRPLNKGQDINFKNQVDMIIQEVRANGDAAILKYTEQFDQVKLNNLKITSTKLNDATHALSSAVKNALEFSIENITTYHQGQIPSPLSVETRKGVICSRETRAIQCVGLYVPGGSAPLISTVMMLAIPAKLAGCPARILCTPPQKDGNINPILLATAKMCGIENIYTIGGVQAIAAMAYGTQTIPKVNKIFGPGNSWVTEAKIAVSKEAGGCAIDLPAGPSELMIIADHNANVDFIAADLLSQAEHGVDSQVFLVTSSQKIFDGIDKIIKKQMEKLSRKLIIQDSLKLSAIILVENLDEAVVISNAYAPEHLILHCDSAEAITPTIQSAGSIFVGQWAPETAGDYVTGSNHVLPTYGHAKNYSGLSVTDFLKFITVQKISREGLMTLSKSAEILSGIEGLTAHQAAIKIRFNGLTDLIRPDLQTFKPYSSAGREALRGDLRLNANESPWGNLNRYPEPQPALVIQKIAEVYQTHADKILLTRGADESIDLLVRLFCEAQKDAILICPPTYGMYEVSARLQGAKVISVNLLKEQGFQLDVPKIIEQWQPRLKLIFLCSPGNPTGNLLNLEDIIKICEYFSNKSMIVVDEAYIDFSARESCVNHLNNIPNLIVLRTFSKAFGLAGIRCGALIAHSAIVAWLGKIIAPYPIPCIVSDLLLKTLEPENKAKINNHIQIIKKERQKLFDYLSRKPFVNKIWESQANFLLLESEKNKEIINYCLNAGIVLRDVSSRPGLDHCIRISIGLPEENDRLITCLNNWENKT